MQRSVACAGLIASLRHVQCLVQHAVHAQSAVTRAGLVDVLGHVQPVVHHASAAAAQRARAHGSEAAGAACPQPRYCCCASSGRRQCEAGCRGRKGWEESAAVRPATTQTGLPTAAAAAAGPEWASQGQGQELGIISDGRWVARGDQRVCLPNQTLYPTSATPCSLPRTPNSMRSVPPRRARTPSPPPKSLRPGTASALSGGWCSRPDCALGLGGRAPCSSSYICIAHAGPLLNCSCGDHGRVADGQASVELSSMSCACQNTDIVSGCWGKTVGVRNSQSRCICILSVLVVRALLP